MPNGVCISLKLEEERKRFRIGVTDFILKTAGGILDLTHDINIERVRDQRKLKITGIAVIGNADIIVHVVSPEVIGLSFLIERQAHSTRQRNRSGISSCRLIKHSIVAVGKTIFDFVSHCHSPL